MEDRMQNILNLIIKEDINVIEVGKSPYGRLFTLVHILNKLAINENKIIHMFVDRENRSYYVSKLISLITRLDFYLVQNYNSVCDMSWIDKTKKTLSLSERDKYLKAIDKLINSNLLILEITNNSNKISIDDYIDYILKDRECDINYEKPEFIIIDSFESILEKTKYNIDEIIERFIVYSKKYKTKFIIFSQYNNLSEYENINNVISITYKNGASDELVISSNSYHDSIKYNTRTFNII